MCVVRVSVVRAHPSEIKDFSAIFAMFAAAIVCVPTQGSPVKFETFTFPSLRHPLRPFIQRALLYSVFLVLKSTVS